jgi:hypothetical protein
VPALLPLLLLPLLPLARRRSTPLVRRRSMPLRAWGELATE